MLKHRITSGENVAACLFFRRVVNPFFRQIGSKHTTEIVHIIRLYCLGIGIGWHGNIFFHVKKVTIR